MKGIGGGEGYRREADITGMVWGRSVGKGVGERQIRWGAPFLPLTFTFTFAVVLWPDTVGRCGR